MDTFFDLNRRILPYENKEKIVGSEFVKTCHEHAKRQKSYAIAERILE